MEKIKVNLLDSTNLNVQYGLNWGQRENRDPNQAYLQLEPEVYKGDFFPPKGKYFIVKTDDNKTLIFNRAQKQYGCALQTPENNAIIGEYIRQKLNVESGAEIKKDDIIKFQKTDIDFIKIDEINYAMSFSHNWESTDIRYLYSQYLILEEHFQSLKDVQEKIKKLDEISSHLISMGIITNSIYSYRDIEKILKKDIGAIQYHNNIELVEYINFLNSQFFITHHQTTQSTASTAPAAYLTAMRTKPFLLLAGISGTGKSRIVKQLAYESCPDIDSLQDDPTSPGNYQLIEVKPNWHDSTEVIGYESEIGDRHYVLTPFVRFLVKAMRYETKCPFFVCMDEMNLAPVEQYFAEFLSVLESRKVDGMRITSEPLIKAEIFKRYDEQLRKELGLPSSEGDYNDVYEKLKENGLRLPSNLIVVGTVNMDETTHQFSRKVIDRAMTIEMNIADDKEPFETFFEGEDTMHYYDNPQPKELYLPKVVQAGEALEALKAEDAEFIKANVPELLCSLNKALDGTPFKIAYRVQNELVLYFHALREEEEHRDDSAADLLNQAMDAILMMKVLPRIEGDEDMLEKPLAKLAEFTATYPQASKKIAEMQGRLQGAHFTSFWP